MESYIENIVTDVEKLMKLENEARPRRALYALFDKVAERDAVLSRTNAEDAKKFVTKAIECRDAGDIRCYLYLNFSLYEAAIERNEWCKLDARIYNSLAMTYQDEIIRRVVKDYERKREDS